MYPQSYFLFSYFVALIFTKFGVIDYRMAFFVAFVGLFVDIDHYIIYLFKFKEMNLKHAFNRAVKGIYAGRSFIHHYIGFIVITLIFVWLFYYNLALFWIFSIGYYSHMFLDYAHLNILKIKEKMTLKEFGFVEKINKFELLFDIFLIMGIILLWI